MKNNAKWYCCMGSVIEIGERWQDFLPLIFPTKAIHLTVSLPFLLNACIKLGIVTDISLVSCKTFKLMDIY